MEKSINFRPVYYFFLIMKAWLLAVLVLICALSEAQKIEFKKPGYKYVQTIKPPFTRRFDAHEIVISPDQKHLIVNYGSKPTYVVFFQIGTWEKVEEYKLPDWVEFSSLHFEPNNDVLFLKTSRYSSSYYRIQRFEKKIDTVSCKLTPKGCAQTDVKIDRKDFYTADKMYYVMINKRNNRDIIIFIKQEDLNQPPADM